MEKFQLTAFLKILGIGAASGIVYTNNSLFVVSDNSGFLYQYQLQNNQLSKQANSGRNKRKPARESQRTITKNTKSFKNRRSTKSVCYTNTTA